MNREKLLFVTALMVLVATAAYAYASRPQFDPLGEQRVKQSAPGAIAVNLQVARAGELEAYLQGGRANPFTTYVPPRIAATVGEQPRPKPPQPTDVAPKPPTPPRPPRPPVPTSSPESPTRPPKPYEVPVNFRAVMRTDEGQHFVVLQTKASSENRYLREGDIWPETGLTIVRINLDSVLLQNEKGERFLMVGLSESRNRTEGASKS